MGSLFIVGKALYGLYFLTAGVVGFFRSGITTSKSVIENKLVARALAMVFGAIMAFVGLGIIFAEEEGLLTALIVGIMAQALAAYAELRNLYSPGERSRAIIAVSLVKILAVIGAAMVICSVILNGI